VPANTPKLSTITTKCTKYTPPILKLKRKKKSKTQQDEHKQQKLNSLTTHDVLYFSRTKLYFKKLKKPHRSKNPDLE
jgi:hypothetical protein